MSNNGPLTVTVKPAASAKSKKAKKGPLHIVDEKQQLAAMVAMYRGKIASLKKSKEKLNKLLKAAREESDKMALMLD